MIARLSFFILQASFALVCLHFLVPQNIPVDLRFELELIEPISDRTQIFWKSFSDEPYQEHTSRRFGLKAGLNQISMQLSAQDLNWIRIDPLLGEGKAKLSPLCLSYLGLPLDCMILPSPFDSLQLDPQIELQISPLAQESLVTYQRLLKIALTLAITFFFGWLATKMKSVAQLQPNHSIIISPGKRVIAVSFGLLVFAIGTIKFFMLSPVPETAGFTHGAAPVFLEHLFDQKGIPLSDRAGNFAVMMDPFTLFRNFPNQKVFGITTDANGFRGSVGFLSRGTRKPVGLILGGSAAFGWRLQNDTETLDAHLSRQSGIHFINMATVSHLVGQELAMLVHYGTQFKPSVVVDFSGWNDFFENYLDFQRADFGYNGAFQEFQQRLRQLYELQPRKHTKTYLSGGLKYYGQVSAEELAERYVQNVRKMHLFAQSFQTKYILVIQPDLHFKKQRTANETIGMKNWTRYIERKNRSFQEGYLKFAQGIEERCSKEGIAVLNLARSPDFQQSPADLFNDTVHLTTQGNEMVATLLLKSRLLQP